MTRRVDISRIELLVAKSMVDRQGVVRQLQPDQIVQLICRELAKERAVVRNVGKRFPHVYRCNNMAFEKGYMCAIADALAAIGRKGTRG